ncbi:hypothetical protein [uncultured Lamprocystis sp.]|jgi:hypothetical protein|uniref:sacsin N-terminal ATP-binding-like domain-containing protein n=1 Tax=uncultured Lamprocystis sp. TaxID=543132 RepID=UPI0025F91103|nr:hypothetical protein [uncultured Lamprocystis sp.]
MDGYTTDYINLIADNLRDRYDSGFPILKELIQNADDARARTFLFAHHPGFQDAAHPLLQGPGLWFFNDGAFKPSDERALKSFGINSKAGDGSAIGKFGLGMKSAFHLCEAIFYLAWDGEKLYRQGLNPWKQDGQNPHPEWDQDHPGDWNRLEVLAEPLVGEAASWFLLWVPLRRRNQVCSARGDDIAIIARYPGDDPKADLAFLDRPGLPMDLAEILPLLKHLKRIEHRGEGKAFALELKADQRLLGDQVAESSSGRVVLGPSGQSLCFAGMRRESDPEGIFSTLMKSGAWPRSRYRDEHGQEQQAADKTRPEAAVLFCSGPAPETRCDLHWAVFLPVEQGGEPLKFAAGNPGHSLILHGQFFIDAGRKKPHALEDLHQTPASGGAEPIDDARLRLTWNQHLAQRVLMPLVIPALEQYAAVTRLNDAECAALTQALADSQWFRTLATDLPDGALRAIWAINAPILLVPKLEPALVGDAIPDDETLRDWLQVLDSNPDRGISDGEQQAILSASQGLLKTLDTERRGHFLRVHEELRIIAVRDARTGGKQPVSTADVRAVEKAGTLFGFAGASQDVGLTQRLAGALPVSRVWIVTTNVYRDLFSGTSDLPLVTDGRACLAAIGRDESGRLGSTRERLTLLEHANDPGSDPMARRGLRYLLHGSAAHRDADSLPLWFPAHKQHPTWGKLWDQLHGADCWSRVDAGLADAVLRTRWPAVGAHEIDARNLLVELARSGAGIPDPIAFDLADREEILSRIEDQDLWQRLPLHTTVANTPVSARNERVYLAPEGGTLDDLLIRQAILIAQSRNATVADQQRKWLKPLDDRARIEIALGTVEPCRYWQIIADAFEQLQSEIDPDLEAKLSKTPWLPTCTGESVKPEDVIDLAGGLGGEARRLVAEHRTAKHSASFAVPEDLDKRLKAHSAWRKIRDGLSSSGDSGLDRLGLLLEELPTYHIGPWPTTPQPDVVALLAQCPLLPGWKLLQQAADEPFSLDGTWQRLRSGLKQPLAPDALLKILHWITDDSENWPARKAAGDAYLKQYVDATMTASLGLIGLRLANQRKEWCSIDKLCSVADGADIGIDPSFILDSHQAMLLADRVNLASTGPQTIPAAQMQIDHRLFNSAHQKTPEILAQYFAPWGQWVPTPMIGALLALLEPTSQTLASDYLNPHTYDWLLDQLDEAGDGSIADEMVGLKIAVHVIDSASVEVPNLLGKDITVPLNRDAQTLLAGRLSQKLTHRVQITLREIDPAIFTFEQLAGLLRATAESLCAEIYPPKRSLQQLWDSLDSSDQLEVDSARRKILYHIPFYLRQLSISHSAIAEALFDNDKAFTALAEAGEAGGNARVQSNLNKSLTAVESAIVSDPNAQRAVLDGVKTKLADFQYDLSSIPFELFQNADDAAIELGQIAAHPQTGCKTPPGAQRFLVEIGNDALRFIHWGRPVNARGPVGFDGERRGFGRDLEKMLILSESDKRPHQGLTGKFGLGFKSVLLACDRPRILSGRLALEIVAGILPQPWLDTQDASDALARHTENHRLPGTLIELPGISEGAQAEVLARFQDVAGVLCAFGQAVRSVEIGARPVVLAKGQSGAAMDAAFRRFAWKPSAVCLGVEFGCLHLVGDWGKESDALCVRTEHGALLIALGPDGFRALPDEVPTLWVTAPTKEQAKLGFAVNGRFAIDAGRAKLAGNSDSNLDLAKQIGAEAGVALGELLNHSFENWAAVGKQLRLAADLTPHDFWQPLWLGLTDRWRGRQRDTAAELVRELVLALLRRLSAHPDSIPNGLAEPLRTFTSTGVVRYQLAESLAKPAVLDVLGSWAPFMTKYPAVSLVAPDMGAILKHAGLAKLAPLGVAALVALIDPTRIRPEDARALGRLLLLTEEDSAWELADIKQRLKELQFRTQIDTWANAGKLVATSSHLLDKDEPLRYELAPAERRLHTDYFPAENEDESALELFLACRDRLQAKADDMAQWVLAARSDKARHSALIYLVNGELGETVAEHVRGRDWLLNVFQNPVLLVPLSAEQRVRLQRRLASSEVLDRGYRAVDPLPPPLISHRIDLATALNNIHAWWSSDRTDQAARYRRNLYPGGSIDLTIDPDTEQFDRSSWLILFTLGAFQSIGRTRNQQHRAAIEMCQNRGWWHTFAETDPRKEPDKWLKIIEDYANNQEDDEQWSLWMANFPRLYRLSRWLEEYKGLFLSINRCSKSFSLDKLRTPRTNEQYRGGGFDPPPINRTLSIGSHLVVRELLHHGLIAAPGALPHAIPHAYAPIERIKTLFRCFDVVIETSQDIHKRLVDTLGAEGATFNGDYDIPLRIVAADEGLQQRLFR